MGNAFLISLVEGMFQLVEQIGGNATIFTYNQGFGMEEGKRLIQSR